MSQNTSARRSSGQSRLIDLLSQRDNRSCADCGAPDPKWASANIGVFICSKCCVVHKSLGKHISKVLAISARDWSDEDVVDSMIEVGGNASANSIYEACIPKGFSKPGPEAGHEERSKFIRSKYEQQEFLKPSLRILSTSSKKTIVSRKIVGGFLSLGLKKSVLTTVKRIGMLKVKVIKGSNLAIRDMISRSSDPYVVLTLGQQKVKTTFVKSNLNPVWNEELLLSVAQNSSSIKLQVYDHDTFSADDIMGDAEIDILPMITSTTSFGDIEMFGDMQIGKWLKSNDNALIEDSTVNILGGKANQSISLKLQNVESGEIDLELEWVPLDHKLFQATIAALMAGYTRGIQGYFND